MLGKIQPQFFPAVFGPAGDEPLDADVVRAQVRRPGAARSDARPATRARRRQVAEGFIDIAVGNMANAIKKISVQRGHDVTDYTLRCFGGAGGQHACLVADALGMTRVFIHPLAGVLSAYGMGLADITRDARAGGRGARSTDANCSPARGDARALRRRRARGGARARACRRTRVRVARARAPALRGHRHGADRATSARSRPWSRAFEAAYRKRFAS